MADELLTTAEVAELLRVNRSTVTRWVRLGQLKAVKLPSGVLRIKRSEVDRMLRDEENE